MGTVDLHIAIYRAGYVVGWLGMESYTGEVTDEDGLLAVNIAVNSLYEELILRALAGSAALIASGFEIDEVLSHEETEIWHLAVADLALAQGIVNELNIGGGNLEDWLARAVEFMSRRECGSTIRNLAEWFQTLDEKDLSAIFAERPQTPEDTLEDSDGIFQEGEPWLQRATELLSRSEDQSTVRNRVERLQTLGEADFAAIFFGDRS